MDKIGVNFEVIVGHFRHYFKSLKNYPDRYLHFFYENADKDIPHFAYLCPLCISRGIITTDGPGLGVHGEFSLDHFPPESVGGKEKIIVCKKCNNEAGDQIDYSLKEKIKEIAFDKLTPEAKVPGKNTTIVIEEDSTQTNVKGRYPSLLSIGEDGKVEISLKPNSKSHTPPLDEFIEYSKTNNNYKITITVPRIDDGIVAKALLKTAYLYCFSLWGYEFVFSNTGEMIRRVLYDEMKYPALTPRFYLGEFVKQDNSFSPPIVSFVKYPEEWKSFLVNIALIDTDTGFYEIASVLIPGPNKSNWENLEAINSLIGLNPVQKVELENATLFNITNSDMGYSQCWEFFNKQGT